MRVGADEGEGTGARERGSEAGRMRGSGGDGGGVAWVLAAWVPAAWARGRGTHLRSYKLAAARLKALL